MLLYEARLLSGEDLRRLLEKAEEVLDRAADRGWRNGGRYDDGRTLRWLFRLTKPQDMDSDAQATQGTALCVFTHQKAPDALLHFLRTCERHTHRLDGVDDDLQTISNLLGYSSNGEKIFPYPDSAPSPSASVPTSSGGTQLVASDGGERDAAQVDVETSARAMEYFLWNIDDWGLEEEERNVSSSQANTGRVSGDGLMPEVERVPAGVASTCLGRLRLY